MMVKTVKSDGRNSSACDIHVSEELAEP